MKVLTDLYERKFQYLRLSLTDKCNFRCTYCLPNGYKSTCSEADLKLNEITNLLNAFKILGFTKIRLTGGEPTLRKDLVDVVKLTKEIGFSTIALTTNGFNLDQNLNDLYHAGLDQINISLDSLSSEGFKAITGSNLGLKVKSSIEEAIDLGMKRVKVNTVLLKDLNDFEFPQFVAWVKDLPVTIRFIELMPTGFTSDYFDKHFCSSQKLKDELLASGWKLKNKNKDSGPADEYIHSDYQGSIGFITPLNSGFCDTCNRLRVSSRGALRLCLFGKGDIDLRGLLQSNQSQDELIQLICSSMNFKIPSHLLSQGDYGDTKSLSSWGG